jgi:putative endonuclease
MLIDSKQSHAKKLGNHGEHLVAQWLVCKGFTIIERNYRISQGEIDIIAKLRDTIAFVEVKTRQKSYFSLSDVIVPHKQRAMFLTARMYCLRHNYTNLNYRFDVAFVQGSDNAITYIPNAFVPQTDI